MDKLYSAPRTKLYLLKCLIGLHFYHSKEPKNLAPQGHKPEWVLRTFCELCGKVKIIE